jgi:hypothetical protein
VCTARKNSSRPKPTVRLLSPSAANTRVEDRLCGP